MHLSLSGPDGKDYKGCQTKADWCLMATFNADNAQCLIFTFKEGLLSKVAHDLKLDVRTFEIRWENGEIMADFDPRSIAVIHAMKNGRPNPSALSVGDKAKVLENMHRDVLKTNRFPTIRFSASSLSQAEEQVVVDGYLDLTGKKRPMRAIARRHGTHWDVEVSVHQPDFGIRPFKALMGAIKIKPAVKVVLRLPVEA